jgi:hypothetical protein
MVFVIGCVVAPSCCKVCALTVTAGAVVGKENDQVTATAGRKGAIAVAMIPFRIKPPKASMAARTPCLKFCVSSLLS